MINTFEKLVNLLQNHTNNHEQYKINNFIRKYIIITQIKGDICLKQIIPTFDLFNLDFLFISFQNYGDD